MKKKPTLTPLEARLRRKYTKTRFVSYDMNHIRLYRLELIVGCQSFDVSPFSFVKDEAEWFRDMLAKALAQIVKENT